MLGLLTFPQTGGPSYSNFLRCSLSTFVCPTATSNSSYSRWKFQNKPPSPHTLAGFSDDCILSVVLLIHLSFWADHSTPFISLKHIQCLIYFHMLILCCFWCCARSWGTIMEMLLSLFLSHSQYCGEQTCKQCRIRQYKRAKSPRNNNVSYMSHVFLCLHSSLIWFLFH